MQLVRLENTTMTLSRLAFGTTKIQYLRDATRPEHLIQTAFDAGFTHFDTAPYYGFGIAETTLGAFTRARHDITISTKVGLYPPGRTDQSSNLVWARKLAGKLIPYLSKPTVDFSVGRARESLRGSLRRLRRDR